tara:strand:- start:24 stop:524 length:501 start_codon:yes stop_codon:yes gene_type:complete
LNWGDTSYKLKQLYPDVVLDSSDDSQVYVVNDNILDIEVKTYYTFLNDKLIIGKYLFSPKTRIDSKEHLKNFKKVAEKVNYKYKMERNDKWVDRSYINRPNDLYFALQIGDVTVYAESKIYMSEIGNTIAKIIHSIEMINGRLNHTLTYYSQEGFEYISEKTINDF